jgi:hypothetical protein
VNTFDEILKTFFFLTNGYGFQLIETRQVKNFKGEYFVVYRNSKSKLQLEISADSSYFHCEIRRLINEKPAKYSNKDSSLGFESLAIFESDNNYEHLDYYAGGQAGLEGVLKNTANLFQRHKNFFTTDIWIDTKKIEQLRDEEMFKKFGFKPSENKNKLSYFSEIKKLCRQLLNNKGFDIIFDNNELPPFDERSNTEAIIFSKGQQVVEISAEDWRDFYYIFYIKVNNNKIFEIDLSEPYELKSAIDKTMQTLKQWIEKNGY